MNCAICLEVLKTDVPKEYKCVLSCNHEFHPTCLLKWFKKSTTCPTCRKEHVEKNAIQTENVQESTNIPYLSSLLEIINSTHEQIIPNRLISHQVPSNHSSPIFHTSNNLFAFPSLSTLSEDMMNRSSEDEIVRHINRNDRRRDFISLILDDQSMT